MGSSSVSKRMASYSIEALPWIHLSNWTAQAGTQDFPNERKGRTFLVYHDRFGVVQSIKRANRPSFRHVDMIHLQ